KTCTQTITWREDTTPPVLANCPAPTLPLGCNPGSVPTGSSYNVTATDACGTATLTTNEVTVTNGCLRTRTITYTAVDGCNNSNTCTQVITWRENTTVPTLVNCPAPTLDLGCNPTSVPTCASYNVTASDGCQPTVSCSSVETTSGCVHTR